MIILLNSQSCYKDFIYIIPSTNLGTKKVLSLYLVFGLCLLIYVARGVPGPYDYAGQKSIRFLKLAGGKYHGKKVKSILFSV